MEMISPLVIESDVGGAPAALVAAWLLAEVGELGGVDVDIVGSRLVRLNVRALPDRREIESRVITVLTDSRFDGWSMQPAPL